MLFDFGVFVFGWLVDGLVGPKVEWYGRADGGLG